MRFRTRPEDAGRTFNAGSAFQTGQQYNALASGGAVVPTPYGPAIFPGQQGPGTNALAAAAPVPSMAPARPSAGAPSNEYVASVDDNDPRRGSGVSEQTSSPAYSTKFGYELGGKERPNKPQVAVMNTLGLAAEQALGPGARVVVYSGQEDPGNQYGSNRHKTGLASDVRLYDPQGNLVPVNSPQAAAFMQAAAANGARGIGAGSEYMGDAFHVDLVPHEDYGPNQGPVWGSAAKGQREALLQAMGL